MDAPSPPPTQARVLFRHRLSTRLWHWLNALVLAILLMSGLMIFNAHPRLYWGQYGANFDPAWLELPPFPGWATIPSTYDLAGARRWHLAFAWIFGTSLAAYLIWSALNGHLRRDIWPRLRDLSPRVIWHDIREHAALRFPTGDAARHYNVLQKLSYGLVLLLLLPLMVLTGLAMSPAMNAVWPWLLDIFAGRQSARSIHFICAALLVLFTAVHLAMVLLSGPVNELRSMITGRYRLPPEKSR